MKITAEQIYKIAPHAAVSIVGPMVDHWFLAEKNGIVTPRQTAFFLGHSATETMGFTRLEESLHYTTAARVRGVWPKRFKTDAEAVPYLRDAVKLGNFVYGGRMGNEKDGTADNDGFDFRGSGMMHTTGFDNFAEVEKVTGLPVTKEPGLLRTMPAALEAAAIFWKARGLSAMVDGADAIARTTRVINGGSHGLADRTVYINRFLSAFSGIMGGANIVLRFGSRSPNVLAMQEKLKALGFYGGKLDGDFGGGTLNAVREYQEAMNINPVDGIAGRVTLGMLNEERINE
jgi:putative chitinase